MPGNPQKPSPLGKVPRRGGRGPHPFRPAPLPRSVWTSNPGDLFSHLLRKCQLPQRGSLIAAGPQTTKSGAASSMSLRGAERRGNPVPKRRNPELLPPCHCEERSDVAIRPPKAFPHGVDVWGRFPLPVVLSGVALPQQNASAPFPL